MNIVTLGTSEITLSSVELTKPIRLGDAESVWQPNCATDGQGNWFRGTNTGLIHSCFSTPHDTAPGHVGFLAGTGINLKRY